MQFNKRNNQKIVMTGVLLISLVILIAGIEGIDFKEGQAIHFFDLNVTSTKIIERQDVNQTILSFLLYGVSFILIILLVYLIFSPRLWKKILKITITVISFYILIYILIQRFGVIFNTAASSGPSEDSVLVSDLVDSLRTDPPDSLIFLISFIFVLGGMIGSYFFWMMSRKEEKFSTLDHLSDKAQEALDQIKTGENLKNTIIRCYGEMSDALNHHQNIQRDIMMTPREFEKALLQYPLPQEAIQELTHLFELVRYGKREVGEAEEAVCVECLTTIIQACHENKEIEAL